MYSDPTKIRTHVVKLRLSDEEHALLSALVVYTGEQRAALMRSLVMERVLEILGDGGEANKAASYALSGAS